MKLKKLKKSSGFLESWPRGLESQSRWGCNFFKKKKQLMQFLNLWLKRSNFVEFIIIIFMQYYQNYRNYFLLLLVETCYVTNGRVWRKIVSSHSIGNSTYTWTFLDQSRKHFFVLILLPRGEGEVRASFETKIKPLKTFTKVPWLENRRRKCFRCVEN